ncbi:MAG: DMT family transporter, partial [Gammaproteobacteria bacterium]
MSRAPALLLPFAAFVLLCAVWGYSWVLLKLGLLDAGPFGFAGLRTLLGACALLLALPLSGRALVVGRWRELVLLGLVNTTGLVGCSQWALVEGAANRTSILVYTMPFWTLLLARPLLGERVRGLQWPAIAAAAVGLLCVLRPWAADGALEGSAASSALGLAAAWLWAVAVIMVKRMQARGPVDLLALTAWQMFFGSLVLCAIAIMAGEQPVQWSERFIVVLLVTALISTGMGWALWVYLLHRVPAGTASLMTLMVPVVAVASSSWQLDETLAFGDLLGITAIVAGLALLAIQALQAHRSVTGT